MTDAVVLDLPLEGRWLARNSPARRVPSHGTNLFGTTYAIDLIPVDETGRSAPPSLRSWLRPEPPEAFVGFGARVLSPVAGTVVAVHDSEPDHEARRSQLTLIPYMAGQAARVREGVTAIAGNHVVVALAPQGPFVLLAHLRRGSARVRLDDAVSAGDHVGDCGNSGNSTQPHLHLQATDTTAWETARGLPIVFRAYRRCRSGQVVEHGLPSESEVVEPLA